MRPEQHPTIRALTVRTAIPSDQYAQAAQEALSKLSPEERADFVKMLQDRAAARGVNPAGKGAAGSEGTGPSAHRAAYQAGAAPGYARR